MSGFDTEKYYILFPSPLPFSNNTFYIREYVEKKASDFSSEIMTHFIDSEIESALSQARQYSHDIELCHVLFRINTQPVTMYVVFDAGEHDRNFKNRVKLKAPCLVDYIRPESDEFIKALKASYTSNQSKVYDHGDFTAHIYED